MRRVFWALVGVGLGAVVGVQVVKWAGKTKERYSPPNLARDAAGAIGSLGARVRDAIDEGRREMQASEITIRADLGLPPK